ncbi:MAG: AAA family ATPase [Chloroflexota bacterium]|nr:AAA family ATPase [Chloroflexota bacterium]
MFIEQITLQNIKSYGSTPTTIFFKEGVNLIAGANGAGKSTILEAIGFVLFDALPYSQGDFERRGKTGVTRITIRLHSSYDNRVYDVERVIPARYRVIDVQDHIDEGIQSKDDLLEWLCQHLKIEGSEDLAPLFENAVGVQQGTITAVFLESAKARKTTFDSLLRVQDFELAWNQLGDTKRYIADLLMEQRFSYCTIKVEHTWLARSSETG